MAAPHRGKKMKHGAVMSNSALAKIHIAKKDLALDDDTYRALLKRITKQTSSAKMNDRQHVAVLAEFKRLGWDQQAGMRKKQTAGRSSNDLFSKAGAKRDARWRKPSDNPHIRKVWALGKELDNRGYWSLSWKQGLKAFVKKETGIDDPDWLDTKQTTKIIEALKAIVRRA